MHFLKFSGKGCNIHRFFQYKGSSNEVRLYVFKATSLSYPHSCIYSMDLFKSFSWEHLVRIEGVLFCSFWPDHKVTGIGICPWIRDFLFSFILMISFEKSVFIRCCRMRGAAGKMWVDFLRFLTLKEILFDLHGFPHALFLKWYTFL